MSEFRTKRLVIYVFNGLGGYVGDYVTVSSSLSCMYIARSFKGLSAHKYEFRLMGMRKKIAFLRTIKN